jgi:hypothetical protein
MLNQSKESDKAERSLNNLLIMMRAMISYCFEIYIEVDFGR